MTSPPPPTGPARIETEPLVPTPSCQLWLRLTGEQRQMLLRALVKVVRSLQSADLRTQAAEEVRRDQR